MDAWANLTNRLMIVGTLLVIASLVSTPTIGADNDDKLNRIDEESKTTDSEICIAFINSLAAEKEKGILKGCDVDLQVKNGTMELHGTVATNEQLKLLLRSAQSTKGVGKIINRLSIKSSKAANPPADNSAILRELAEARKLIQLLDQRLRKLEAEVSARGGNAQAKPPQATWPTWPTYSTGYPGNAWPNYTVPPYPLPHGWTPVKLEWDDGHWQLFPAKEKTKDGEQAPSATPKDNE